MSDDLENLANLLQQRLDVIADHEFRDRDPEAHLARLVEVSEAIDALHEKLSSENSLKPRLKHFLDSRSYQKALDFLRS